MGATMAGPRDDGTTSEVDMSVDHRLVTRPGRAQIPRPLAAVAGERVHDPGAVLPGALVLVVGCLATALVSVLAGMARTASVAEAQSPSPR